MAQTKKSWQDYLTASFGQQEEAHPGSNYLVVGGLTSGSVAQNLPIGTSASGTALIVDLLGAEQVSVSSLTTGSIVVTNGTIASVGTSPGVGVIGNVNAGSIIVTNGTVVGGIGTYQGTFAIGSAQGSGTVTPAINGVARTWVICTPDLADTGTVTLRLIDGVGGTIFSQAQTESGTTVYGSVVPLSSEMQLRCICDAAQTAAVSVVAKIYYDK